MTDTPIPRLSDALHRIVVERDTDGEPVSARFVCDGDRTAPCHQYPECGCEYWSVEHDTQPGHGDVSHDRCWVEPWLDDAVDGVVGFVELYDGELGTLPLEDLVSGPVTTSWEGDYVTWDYDVSRMPEQLPLGVSGE